MFDPSSEVILKAETAPAPTSPDGLLELARSLIADDLLTPTQLGLVQNSPRDFLRSLAENGEPAVTIDDAERADTLARQVIDGIAQGYFASLIAKRAEGEKYSQERLAQALLKAQIVAIEALEQVVGEASTSPTDKARIAEVLKN